MHLHEYENDSLHCQSYKQPKYTWTIDKHTVKYVVLLYWKMNEDTTCTRCSALVKARNAHICCKLWLVGFKAKESPTYTVSSQEKNWFLEEENGVMAEHGSLNYNCRVSWKERELHRWMHFVIILTILVLFRYLISTRVNFFSPRKMWIALQKAWKDRLRWTRSMAVFWYSTYRASLSRVSHWCLKTTLRQGASGHWSRQWVEKRNKLKNLGGERWVLDYSDLRSLGLETRDKN